MYVVASYSAHGAAAVDATAAQQVTSEAHGANASAAAALDEGFEAKAAALAETLHGLAPCLPAPASVPDP